MHAKRVDEYLAADQGTSRLLPQVAVLRSLRQQLCSALPHHLLRSCAIANYKQGTIVLWAGNNAVAAKLRLLTPRLIETLSKRGLQVTGIRVQVQAGSVVPMEVSDKKNRLVSPTASAALTNLSKNLPDSRLKRALLSLAAKAE